MKWTELKVSKEFMANIHVWPGNKQFKGVPDYIKHQYPDSTGYLFEPTEDEGVLMLKVFEEATNENRFEILLSVQDIKSNLSGLPWPISAGTIQTFDEATKKDVQKIKDTISQNEKLNGHAKLINVTTGCNNNDFIHEKLSVVLRYSFSQ